MTSVFCGFRSAPIPTLTVKRGHRQRTTGLLSLRLPTGHVAGRQLHCVFLNHRAESLESAASCYFVQLEAAVLPLGRPTCSE